MNILKKYHRRLSISDTMESIEETERLLSTYCQAIEVENTGLLYRHRKLVLFVLVFVALAIITISSTLVINFVVIPTSSPTPAHEQDTSLKILSLSVWGSPQSFGTRDKTERIEAIAEYIKNHTEIDVFLLQELWMRPDHQIIRSMIPRDYVMTNVGDLASSVCDGRIAPTFCSGLAVVSKFPFLETSFTSYSTHGYILYTDGEYWTRKGVGRVRVQPAENYSVDVFLTSTCAFVYNSYYRQIQAAEFAASVNQSTAEFVIAAGNLNTDPRSSETSYTSVRDVVTDTREQFLGVGWLDTNLDTFGNKNNTYTSTATGLVYDYFWHKSSSNYTISVEQFQVPLLKTKKGHSLSNHEAVLATFGLQKEK